MTILKRRHLLVAAAGAVVLAATNLTLPVSSAATTEGGPTEAALRTVARRVLDAGATGVILRVDDGRHVTRFALGAARLAPHRDLAPDDEIRVGSNIKMFVSTVALQLVAEHRLRLDDPVRRWLPGLIPDDDRITLRMLLAQTSGLYDYTEDDSFNEIFLRSLDRVEHVFTPRELVGYATAHPSAFAPGTEWAYSNTNYVVAGMILEKVTGTPVGELIDRRIARPLHLQHTYLERSSAFRGRYAHGYWMPEQTGAGYVDTAGRNDASAAWASGALVSTVDDLARFNTALLAGRLMPPAQLREMTTLVPRSADRILGRGSAYGLGLISVATDQWHIWGHGGSIPGYFTFSFTDGHGRSMELFVTTEPTEELASAANDLLLAAVAAMTGTAPPRWDGSLRPALRDRVLRSRRHQ
ncbi:MAG TPA: serine hydrolase domain-containing protein [Kineosporiaceae bacterium]|nr:serine hydrolase domain-containing protein [Kineosporiaceae bacterium]